MNLEKMNAHDAFAITPSDGANLPRTAFALYIGVSGNVRVSTADGTDVTFVGLSAGSYLNLQVRKVWATNTTASSLVGLL